MRWLLPLVFLSACASHRGATPASSAPPTPRPAAASHADVASKAASVDEMLRRAWAEAGLTPAPRTDDARFLRRAYIDVVGTIPPPSVVAAFLDDAAPDKRGKLVARLVESPEYVDHWVEYWDGELMGRDARGQDVDRAAFRSWLRARFQKNAPWNQIARELVSAAGANSAGGPRIKGPALGERDGPEADGVNGAVNWTLRYAATPQDLAGAASRELLGVQIQCAQCHDHKTEKWKKADFERFAAVFVRTRIEQIDKGKTMGVKRAELVDLERPAPRFAKNPELAGILAAKPTALDGTDLSKGNARAALADWMTSPKNPWFARAIVNRMWGHFLGRGFVNPIDDFRPSNPPALEPVLDALAADFAAHGYDLKHLVRTICATEAYNLSSSTTKAKVGPDNALWASFRLAPLGPEELLNALLVATNVEAAARRAGIPNLEQLRERIAREYAFAFDVDEDVDQVDFQGTIAQALMLLNGNLVGVGTTALPQSALDDLLAETQDDDRRITALYVRVLSRRPGADELARAKAHVSGATPPPAPPPAPGPKLRKPRVKAQPGDALRAVVQRKVPPTTDAKRAAYEDLLWALVNSSEFTLNH